MGSKYTEAQNKATQKYIKNAYDTITVRYCFNYFLHCREICNRYFSIDYNGFTGFRCK